MPLSQAPHDLLHSTCQLVLVDVLVEFVTLLLSTLISWELGGSPSVCLCALSFDCARVCEISSAFGTSSLPSYINLEDSF